jgi:hypothetical protein
MVTAKTNKKFGSNKYGDYKIFNVDLIDEDD